MDLPSSTPNIPLYISGREDDEAHTLLFVHGWPDDERMFIQQTNYFGAKYRVASVRLPWFSTISNANADAAQNNYSPTGYTLHELVDALILARRKLGEERAVTVICHDWGAILTQLADLDQPGIFRRIITIDVALTPWMVRGARWRSMDIVGMAVYGFLYMWHAALCSIVYRVLPGIATRYMRWLVNYCTKDHFWKRPGLIHALDNDSCGLRAALAEYPARGEAHPLSGYVYFDIHRLFWLGLLGMAPKLARKLPPSGNWKDYPTCPTLFVYGGIGPKFHSEKWEQNLSKRKDGSEVVKFEDAGHWVMLEKATELNAEIERWIEKIEEKVASGK